MLYISTHHEEIWNILGTGRISPRFRGIIISHLKKVESSSGPKFLLSYLRRIRDEFLTIHEGKTLHELRKAHRSRPLFKGPLLPLFNLSLRYGKLETALNLISLGGLFKHEEATLKDYRKKISDLNKIVDVTDFEMDDPDEFYQKMIESGPTHSELKLAFDNNPNWVIGGEYPSGLTNLVMPDNSSIKLIEACPEDHIRSLDSFPDCVVSEYQYFKALVGDHLPKQEHFHNLISKKSYKGDYAGRAVALTKDRNLKLRFIFNGIFLLQLALEPLHLWLKSYLKKNPDCFCFNQDEGTRWVEEYFSKNPNIRLTSLDIQSSSDSIPYTPQRIFLEQLLPKNLPYRQSILNILNKAVRMKWFIPHSLDKSDMTFISFKGGTPMGLKSCYYLFTTWLLKEFNRVGLRGRCAVVGDDLVFDDRFTDVVLDFFKLYNIPISTHKSMFNRATAEFCGRVVTRTDGILRRFSKAKELDYKNPVPGLNRLGPNVFREFRQFRKYSDQKRKNLETVSYMKLERADSEIQELIGKERPNFNMGFYTIFQLERMGLVDKDEREALLNLLIHQIDIPDAKSFRKSLEGPFQYKKRVRDTASKKKVKYKEIVVKHPHIISFLPLNRAPQDILEVLARQHKQDHLDRTLYIEELYQTYLAGRSGVPGTQLPALSQFIDNSPVQSMELSVEYNLEFLATMLQRSNIPQLRLCKPRFIRFGRRSFEDSEALLKEAFEKFDLEFKTTPQVMDPVASTQEHFAVRASLYASIEGCRPLSYRCSYLAGRYRPESSVSSKNVVRHALNTSVEVPPQKKKEVLSQMDNYESDNLSGKKYRLALPVIGKTIQYIHLVPQFAMDLIGIMVRSLDYIRLFSPRLGKKKK